MIRTVVALASKGMFGTGEEQDMRIDEGAFKAIKTRRFNRVPIRLLSDFVDYVQYLQDRWNTPDLWFRGVSKVRYKLTPSVYRTELVIRPSLQTQTEILHEFIRRSKTKVASSHTTYHKWEWYETMQHYGMPTRLLDWTEGALIALYFAVRNLSSVANPVVWVLDPYWLNLVSTGDESLIVTDITAEDDHYYQIANLYIGEFNNIPEQPIAVLPSHINERVVSQKSCFTVHGKCRDGFSAVFERNKDPHLVQLRIDNEVAEELKDAVIAMGISESTIFPDLEGLARELIYEFQLYKKT